MFQLMLNKEQMVKSTVKISILEDDEYIEAETTCSKVNTFVLNTGIDIAGKRLKIKLLHEELKQYINKFRKNLFAHRE